ncbi:membrane-binding protein [Capnocytophaga canimorsus]|uniref:membrane-binding protein n=1 Tax=Capnocytophaga canimorsus TaxID=28188 RepID=UPI0028EE87A5|nr:membrane-binding protein [Capnocytophaga canimorsus]MDT9499287.1 membrane-binding protein [Capnocytophaga canimorsus]
MARNSFAENITRNQMLVKGLQGRAENLPIGVTAEIVTEMDALNKQAMDLNTEQEKLKAQLKEKTAQLDTIIKSLEEKHAFVKKYVKLGVPKGLWREFGIEDKR